MGITPALSAAAAAINNCKRPHFLVFGSTLFEPRLTRWSSSLAVNNCSNYHFLSGTSCQPWLTPRFHNFRCNASSLKFHSHSTIHSSESTLKMETRYQITPSSEKEEERWIRISFPDSDETTGKHLKKKAKNDNHPESKLESASETAHAGTNSANSHLSSQSQSKVPDSVLQYERQLRKIKASDRASKTKLTIQDHLHTVYVDEHVVVTNKPSGILCVPGVNKNKSLLDLVFEVYGDAGNVKAGGDGGKNGDDTKNVDRIDSVTPLPRDSMIVHRIDMDTSGLVAFARTRLAMSKLHASFRERSGTKKTYEALLVGWLDINLWISSYGKKNGDEKHHIIENAESRDIPENLGGGEINLPLQRDHKHPPFMRVSTPESEAEAHQAVKDLNHAGWKKLVAKRPKPSITHFRVLSHEKWMGIHPVTRVQLTPITGRTHQLRVHCAAIGHPILGDPTYGFCGEAHPNGGFLDYVMDEMSPSCAGFELRRDVEESVRLSGRTMCLHARELSLDHPVTGERVTFKAASPF